jgi:hypothetical protein
MPLEGPCWQGTPDGSVCVAPGGLYERDDELARVDAPLTAARVGRGGGLLIVGQLGQGHAQPGLGRPDRLDAELAEDLRVAVPTLLLI